MRENEYQQVLDRIVQFRKQMGKTQVDISKDMNLSQAQGRCAGWNPDATVIRQKRSKSLPDRAWILIMSLRVNIAERAQ